MLPIQRKSITRTISIAFLAVMILLVIGKPIYRVLSNYLSLTNPIDADILLVEGWMSSYAIDMAVIEFEKEDYSHIITTGILENQEYYLMSMNGNLVFFLGDNFTSETEDLNHSIEFDLFGDTKGSNKAHFNIFINDSLISSHFAKKRKISYEIQWYGKIEDIDSITIQFDNDKIGSFGDRNINVKEIIIDHNEVIGYKNNSIYQVTAKQWQERRLNSENTYAEIARSNLIKAEIDSSKITAISGRLTSMNRTLASALAVRDHFELNPPSSNDINILSIGPHSRRTWLTYKKILGKNYNIGIIALPDYKPRYTKIQRAFYALEELMKIFYYKLILMTYSKYGVFFTGLS